MLPKDRMQRGTDEEWRGGVKPHRDYTQGEVVGIVRHMQTLALLRPPGHAGPVRGEEEQVLVIERLHDVIIRNFRIARKAVRGDL